MKTTALLSAVAAAAVAGHASAAVETIDLDAYAHGAVLNGVDLGPGYGDADNFHSSTDLLVAFDTTQRDTRDPDLEGPNGSSGGWARGNLKASNHIVGTTLIVQEMRNFAGYTDSSQDTVNKPDDEGRRRNGTLPGAGEVMLSFDLPVNGFGFTLVDIEETGEFNNQTGFFASFFGGGETAKVAFADLIDPSSRFYDPTVAFGNNSANRIQLLTAQDLGLPAIERVMINFGGSGAVGELRYLPLDNLTEDSGSVVPTPGAAAAALAGLGGLGLLRRRRRA